MILQVEPQHNMKTLGEYSFLHATILSVPFRQDDGIHIGQVAKRNKSKL